MSYSSERYDIYDEIGYARGSIAYNDLVYNLYHHMKRLIKNPELMAYATFDLFYAFIENPFGTMKCFKRHNPYVSISIDQWFKYNEIELHQLHQSLMNNIARGIPFSVWTRFVYNTSHHQESFRNTYDMVHIETRDPYDF